jgi:hypothetical protein
MSRQKGMLTPGLCIVADGLSVAEAYELAHERPIESIKFRPRGIIGADLGEAETLTKGDFAVICDGKYYLTRKDEITEMLRLFVYKGLMPDAVTYAPFVSPQIMFEVVDEILGDSRDVYDTTIVYPDVAHTIVLSGIMPEQRGYTAHERMEILKERMNLAADLTEYGGRIAVCAAAVDLMVCEKPDGVLTMGAGIRDFIAGNYTDLETASEHGIDIPLVGKVMGENADERRAYLDPIAPRTRDI